MPQALASSNFVAENLNTELTRWTLYSGGFAFVTSGTTVTVKVPDAFRHYHVVGWIYTGTPASTDGPLSVPADDGNGVCTAEGSAGGYYVTLTRPAGTTSGLHGTITFRALPG